MLLGNDFSEEYVQLEGCDRYLCNHPFAYHPLGTTTPITLFNTYQSIAVGVEEIINANDDDLLEVQF